MEPKIQQIVVMESKVCGLGDDNKVYRWDYARGIWVPNWNTALEESAPQEKPADSL